MVKWNFKKFFQKERYFCKDYEDSLKEADLRILSGGSN